MKRLIWIIALFWAAAHAAETPVPGFQLDKNAIEVKVEGKRSPLLACTARLTFPGNDLPGLSSESYLIQYDSGYPIVVDKIDGFAVSLEVRDVSGDGQNELVAFFSAGANNYGVKVFRLTKTRYQPKLYPLLDQPALSNMHSIKIVEGDIHDHERV